MMFCVVFSLIFFVKAYVVGTSQRNLNHTHNICLYKEDTKYTGCNLKTMELLDCALIRVCAVIRSNVFVGFHAKLHPFTCRR